MSLLELLDFADSLLWPTKVVVLAALMLSGLAVVVRR